MIGDTIPQSRFAPLCSEFRLVTSGTESVRDALENAITLLNAMRLERANRDHLSTVLDMFEKAVFSLDHSGLITHANQAATTLFKMSRDEMIGLPIEAIDPALVIAHDTIADRIWEVGQVVETRQGNMVSYLTPTTARAIARASFSA
jgi:nitrogen fixation/metabolism regulation signal transduction histidine kinase